MELDQILFMRQSWDINRRLGSKRRKMCGIGKTAKAVNKPPKKR